jgi:hypothetical protein
MDYLWKQSLILPQALSLFSYRCIFEHDLMAKQGKTIRSAGLPSRNLISPPGFEVVFPERARREAQE